jgi:5-formyltetrahydrofolate cyclo-ligase
MTDTEQTEDERMQHALRVYAKRELRTRMQSVRNVLPISAHAERSARACERVIALPEFAAARNIAAYVAMRKEIDPRAVLDRAAELGKLVLLPRVEEHGLEFYVHHAGEELVENGWGVLEPAETAERVAIAEIDVMLVPALALDLRGFRIGYGKSFYDRVLPKLTHGRAVGFAYEFQLLAEVPNEAHDQRVHIVVTDKRSVTAE